MKDLLISTISELGYPIFQQGTLSTDEAYPDSFFTFFNRSSDGSMFYDNMEHSVVWDFDLNFYSVDPALVNTELLNAKKLLRDAGFVVGGAGRDVASDEITHTGRGISVLKIGVSDLCEL